MARLRALLLSLVVVLMPALAHSPTAAAVTLGAAIDPLLRQQMAANPLQPLPVIVEMQPGALPLAGQNAQLAQQALNLLQLNGTARVALPLIDSAAGLANAAGITALSVAPGVAYIHLDAQVRAHASTTPLGTAYPPSVEADRVWASGRTGQGVTVAVLDSGVRPEVDLNQPAGGSRILAAVNFADALTGDTDPGGHGTHVASTIAGSGAASNGQFIGVAPAANLVDVRVLDENGNGRVSSVVLGIQWALDHRNQYNIRVLNLSLGAPPPANYRLDPLAAAAEIAWARGVVVVAAAGNDGAGKVDSPGADPYVITVGATDDRQTDSVGDDVLPTFSGWGTPLGSTPKPDLVAPGRRIVASRAPGSALDRLLPDHVVTAANGATYFRLSGTSMATAVVSGVAALLLQQQPTLSPDQVKAVLTGTTRPFGQASGASPTPAAIGAGLVDAYTAVSSSIRTRANRGNRPADTTARSLYSALYGQPLTWKDPLYAGILWSTVTWQNIAWDTTTWDNIAWDNIAWDNIAWDNVAWDNIAWDSTKWDNVAWDNVAWDAQRLD